MRILYVLISISMSYLYERGHPRIALSNYICNIKTAYCEYDNEPSNLFYICTLNCKERKLHSNEDIEGHNSTYALRNTGV